jgi:hypothetical protein
LCRANPHTGGGIWRLCAFRTRLVNILQWNYVRLGYEFAFWGRFFNN